MSGRVEYKVGEIFRSYGETVQCVPDSAGNKNCDQCTLSTRDYSCYSHKCHAYDRSDNTSVHYVKVTEPKEGMLFRASNGILYELRQWVLTERDCGCFTNLSNNLTCDMIDRQSFKAPQKNFLHWYPVEEIKEKQEEKAKMEEKEIRQNRHIEISVVSVEEHTVTFRISQQTHREEEFTQNGREFKSICGIILSSQGSPEFGAYIKTLFVRGWSSSEDDNNITVPLITFAKIMQAVTEYNETDGEGYDYLNVGDTFYIIDEFGDVEEREYEGDTDGIFRRKVFGNFFRTREEAETAVERVQQAIIREE